MYRQVVTSWKRRSGFGIHDDVENQISPKVSMVHLYTLHGVWRISTPNEHCPVFHQTLLLVLMDENSGLV